MERNSWKIPALTLLCIATAVMLSLSSEVMAKYTATASAAASARVAKWNVVFTTGTSTVTEDSVVYLRYGTAAKERKSSDTRYYYVKNNSEVAAKIKLTLRYAAYTNSTQTIASSAGEWSTAASSNFATIQYYSGGTSGYLAHDTTNANNHSVTVGPGGTAAFSVVIKGSPSSPDNATYCLRMFAEATQID